MYKKGIKEYMQEKTLLEQLYVKIFELCAKFAVYHESVMDAVRLIFPEIKCLAEDILYTEDLGLNEEDGRLVRQLLVDILQDLVQSITYQDEVLLEDTLEYGLKDFLEMFIADDERLQQLKEESQNE